MAQKPIIEHAKEFVDDALENAKEGLGTLPPTARKKLGDLNLDVTSTVRRVAEAAGPTWKAVQKQVRQNPGVALCLGAFLGFAIGFLVRGRD